MKMINFFLFLFITSVYSQDGVIRYGEIQSMGMGGPVGSDYNAVLLFDTQRSLYLTRKDSLEGGHVNRMETYQTSENHYLIRNFITNSEGFQFYNNLKNRFFYSRDIGFRYVKEKTPEIDWTVERETKIIGGYECIKAIAHFRGRDYTAWFTTKIPLPYGPWKLQGLPGLILEAYDTNKEIYWYFKSLEYPADCSDTLKPIISNNWITFEEHKQGIIESWKNATIKGRMVGESLGSKSIDNTKSKKSTIGGYIEGFEFEN